MEGYLTVWACWIALYSAVAYGPRTRVAALALAALTATLLGEVVREVHYRVIQEALTRSPRCASTTWADSTEVEVLDDGNNGCERPA